MGEKLKRCSGKSCQENVRKREKDNPYHKTLLTKILFTLLLYNNHKYFNTKNIIGNIFFFIYDTVLHAKYFIQKLLTVSLTYTETYSM